MTKPLWRRKYFCYAPLTNLHFWQNGNISSCCHNRVPLGHYPEQSIRQIWDGVKVAKLRQNIKICDLSAGCFPCEKDLYSMHFKGFKTSKYGRYKVQKKFPSVMEFALSNECNLECIMCRPFYSSALAKIENVGVPVAKYDSAFVNQLNEFIPHLQEARFLGGEPFIIDIYYEIWERIIMLNPACNIIVQTNATILSDKIKKILEKTKFSFNISIDSLKQETYETIRKKASFEKVMKNIDYFSDYCKRKKTYFAISICPLKLNWKEIPDFVYFCQKNNADMFLHTVNWPIKLSIKTFSSKELHDVFENLSLAKFPSGNIIHNKNVEHYKSFLSQIKSWEKCCIDKRV